MATTRTLAILALSHLCSAFNPSSNVRLRSNVHTMTCQRPSCSSIAATSGSLLSRRSSLETLFLGGGIILGLPSTSFAEKDVSDGGLPSGALELNRLLLSQQQVRQSIQFLDKNSSTNDTDP